MRANEISWCNLGDGPSPVHAPKNIALSMLAREGISAIWSLQLAAAKANQDGHKAAASAIIEIAEAAEREWLRRARPLALWLD